DQAGHRRPAMDVRRRRGLAHRPRPDRVRGPLRLRGRDRADGLLLPGDQLLFHRTARRAPPDGSALRLELLRLRTAGAGSRVRTLRVRSAPAGLRVRAATPGLWLRAPARLRVRATAPARIRVWATAACRSAPLCSSAAGLRA